MISKEGKQLVKVVNKILSTKTELILMYSYKLSRDYIVQHSKPNRLQNVAHTRNTAVFPSIAMKDVLHGKGISCSCSSSLLHPLTCAVQQRGFPRGRC